MRYPDWSCAQCSHDPELKKHRECEATYDDEGNEVEVTALYRGSHFEVRLSRCPLHYVSPEVQRIFYLYDLWPEHMPAGGIPLEQPAYLMEAFSIIGECKRELGEDE